ncbi:hypothetical protein Leryth_006572 [Lithospermum erythrorhizon]|uniref:Uncharacterized protein n=1 Tax=Lithospermum erythrorhizon TaxID=34254 RepID=A0AAV3Q295_LITER|nr:hypothetical protein Leryth_006572 [Lithospermum erythrorhizon]
MYELDHNSELDDQRMGEAERTLFISKKADPILLPKECIKKVVKQCNQNNLLMKETSDFGPMEVDAESQKKSLTEGKAYIQLQDLKDHSPDAISVDSSRPNHEKGDTLETAQEVTLEIQHIKHTVNMIQENVDSNGAKKSDNIPTVGDILVDGRRESLLSNQNKANLPDHRPNDSAFPMKIVPSENICLGPLQGPGSVSCRSTSSTTSARSFAFPVLSGEWIGSPVKMAGNSRAHMKRHRWWKHCFGSCKY